MRSSTIGSLSCMGCLALGAAGWGGGGGSAGGPARGGGAAGGRRGGGRGTFGRGGCPRAPRGPPARQSLLAGAAADGDPPLPGAGDRELRNQSDTAESAA